MPSLSPESITVQKRGVQPMRTLFVIVAALVLRVQRVVAYIARSS
jgi:hypothetical protein